MTHANRITPTGAGFDALAFEIEHKPEERKDAAFLAALAMQDIPTPPPTATETDTNRPDRPNTRRDKLNMNLLFWNRRLASSDSASFVRGKRSTQGRGAPVAPATPAITSADTPPPRTTADRVLDLARSAGIYSGHPAPSELSNAQRRAIERELALQMTRHIDWKNALGPDPQNPTAVYYDGLTLRNASNLTIKQAAVAVEKRIHDRLGTRPGGSFDYLVRPLRDDLIGDPTISLQTPPDSILYGSPSWAFLWDGIQHAKRLNMDPVTMRASDLILLAPVRLWRSSVAAPQNNGQDKEKGGSFATAHNRQSDLDARRFHVLVRIANAAGVLKRAESGEIDAQSITEQVSAYVRKITDQEILQRVNVRKASVQRQLIVQRWVVNSMREP